jgi:hypothetical protein
LGLSGTAARPAPDDEPPAASLFVVMQVIVEELEKIEEAIPKQAGRP